MHYALPSKRVYPIETEEQIKTAASYFDKYIAKFNPTERSIIASSMEKRASELKVSLEGHDWVSNYGRSGESYSPDFDLHIGMRKEACAGRKINIDGNDFDAQDVLKKIASKKSEIKPSEMVALISDFDKKASITYKYDSHMRDPHFTVYGSSSNPNFDHVKLACGVSEKKLIVASGRDSFLSKIANAFGKTMADDMKNSPVDTFNSMPTPEKELIRSYVDQEA